MFAYNTGCLYTFEVLSGADVFLVVGQIDLGLFEYELVQREAELWLGWQPVQRPVNCAYWQRMHSESDSADAIFVNSQWSRRSCGLHRLPMCRSTQRYRHNLPPTGWIDRYKCHFLEKLGYAKERIT